MSHYFFLAAIRQLIYKQNLDISPTVLHGEPSECLCDENLAVGPFSLIKIYIVFSQAVTHPGTNTARHCLTSGQWEIKIQTLIAPVGAFRNCLRQLCFKSKWRGIGYSFQLAITAPLYSITGYCIATAQSYLGLNDDLD